MLDIREFQKLNAQRGTRWHEGDLHQWSELEWAGAMCGEAGEAANIAKKLRRVQLGIRNAQFGAPDVETVKQTIVDYKELLAREVADVIIYGLLLMTVCDADAEDVIRDVFNQKSIQVNLPERV